MQLVRQYTSKILFVIVIFEMLPIKVAQIHCLGLASRDQLIFLSSC